MRLGAKETAVIVISAALYAMFFFMSTLIAVPRFTILYLPVILLGVFPSWFGINGLAGSMIGAFLGGYFAEGLGPFAWIESVTTFIIYILNWFLIPKRAAQGKNAKSLVILLGIYAVTLFIGTSYILWQFTALGLLEAGAAEIILLPTFGLNIIIEAIVCPVLIKSVSPKLKTMGLYYGNFWEWRNMVKTESNPQTI
jgi:hypothetical protein